MTRLLFIDFDGVLHPLAPTSQLHPNGWFCWLPLLSALLAPWPDVHLVVHSSWRQHFNDGELRQLLGALGRRCIGSAPPVPKAKAIEAVLRANAGRIRAHVVLDDDIRLAEHPGLNVILCDSRLGLSCPETQSKLSKWLASSRAL